jgi:hypothetical protein
MTRELTPKQAGQLADLATMRRWFLRFFERRATEILEAANDV